MSTDPASDKQENSLADKEEHPLVEPYRKLVRIYYKLDSIKILDTSVMQLIIGVLVFFALLLLSNILWPL